MNCQLKGASTLELCAPAHNIAATSDGGAQS